MSCALYEDEFKENFIEQDCKYHMAEVLGRASLENFACLTDMSSPKHWGVVD